MKKSNKVKGKETAAVKKKAYTMYGIILVAAIILIAAAGYFVYANRTVAKAGDTVGVYYTGTLENGTVFDSNVNKTPLEFTVGGGQMISGFDEAVVGMAVGDEKTVHLPVDKAYGPYRPDLVVVVNRSANLSVTDPYVGEHLTVTNPTTGSTSTVKIINVTPSTITVDANFDLAGQNLTFDIKMASIASPLSQFFYETAALLKSI